MEPFDSDYACSGLAPTGTAGARPGGRSVQSPMLVRAGSDTSYGSTSTALQPPDTAMVCHAPYGRDKDPSRGDPDAQSTDDDGLDLLLSVPEVPANFDLDEFLRGVPPAESEVSGAAAAAALQQHFDSVSSLGAEADGPKNTKDKVQQVQTLQPLKFATISAHSNDTVPGLCGSCSKLLPLGEDLERHMREGSRDQDSMRLKTAKIILTASLSCQGSAGSGSSSSSSSNDTSSLQKPCLASLMSDIASGQLDRFWGIARPKPRDDDPSNPTVGQKRDNGGHAWNGNFHTNSPIPLLPRDQESLLHTLGLQSPGHSSSGSSSSSTCPGSSNTAQLYTIKATSGATTAYALAIEVQHAGGFLSSLWGGNITCKKKNHVLYGCKLTISKYAFVVHNPDKAVTKKAGNKRAKK